MECLTVNPSIEENRMPGYHSTASGTFDRVLTGAWGAGVDRPLRCDRLSDGHRSAGSN